ncbi:hypothetical protein [Phaeovulum sp.]|uniref:hypothetical protein n=1 Tax=Phaeovulum sp. TaxID=2934796 RepID=UPI00272FDC8B|nr:hypothetical protein [Phaeovulum sp.]MDP1668673.1 hypothetical protein [Phaeovulum sp.]
MAGIEFSFSVGAKVPGVAGTSERYEFDFIDLQGSVVGTLSYGNVDVVGGGVDIDGDGVSLKVKVGGLKERLINGFGFAEMAV